MVQIFLASAAIRRSILEHCRYSTIEDLLELLQENEYLDISPQASSEARRALCATHKWQPGSRWSEISMQDVAVTTRLRRKQGR